MPLDDETTQDDELLLTDEEIDETDLDDDTSEDDDQAADEGGETVIAFADEAEEGDNETPLVKRLRQQLRETQRQVRRSQRETPSDTDPEPNVPERPRSVADFDYDEDRFNAALDEHLAAKDAHSAWAMRQSEREATRRNAQEDQARQIEQQRRALGVSDYDERSAKVKDALSEGQLAVLINGADNPAQVIYALGRSESRLDMLSAEQNLARFAVMLGKMEKDIKVSKRTAPNPETQVRGATAAVSMSGADKKLEALEREAAKTGDRTKVQAYKRQLRQKAA